MKDLRLVKSNDTYIAYWKSDGGTPMIFQGTRDAVIDKLQDVGWHQQDIGDELHMADGLVTPESFEATRQFMDCFERTMGIAEPDQDS